MPDVDAIVVGAGAGGPVVAKELAERGLSVLHLEAGAGSADASAAYTRSEYDMTSPPTGRFRWGPGDRDRDPWVRRSTGPSLVLQVAGVGGTTLHYFGNSPRAFPVAVERGDWPVPYSDLVPYYERVEAILPAIRDPRLPTKDALTAYGASSIGLPEIPGRDATAAGWRPQYNAILPPGYAGPGTGCIQCGHCWEGCTFPAGETPARRAKRSTDVSYVPLAQQSPTYRLLADSFATAVVTERRAGGVAARGVQWRNTRTGEVSEASGEVVVLAAGAIETPRLWMNSGLPDANGQVGRDLTLHALDFITGFFDIEVDPHVGQNSQCRIDLPGLGCLETVGLLPGKLATSAFTYSGQWGLATPSEPWDSTGMLVGDRLVEAMGRYARSLTLLVLTDDEADPANRVTLDPDWPADEHGMVPHLAYRPTPKSVRRRDQLATYAAEILRAAGATRVHRANSEPIYLHMQSSMRLGRTPARSVVDENQEAWEVERLFICDGSSLPDGLGGPNPALTIQMFATRTAEHIAVKYFDRRPFVVAGDGVTSPAGFGPTTAPRDLARESAARREL
jgi:choline dehydrogenase-like flavoprotein